MAQRKTRSKTKPLGEKTVKVLFKVQGYTTFMGENPKWRERCVDPKSPHKTLRGISMTEALLIVHETAGAAAQHAANAVALQKPRRKGKKS